MKLGRNLARTFLDYYKLQNYIVFNPTTTSMPKLTASTTCLNLKSHHQTSSTSPVQGSSNASLKNLNNAASNSASNSNKKKPAKNLFQQFTGQNETGDKSSTTAKFFLENDIE